MKRDLYHNLKVSQVLKPAGQDADVESSSIDSADHAQNGGAVAIGDPGVTFSGTDKITVKVQESDSSGSDFTDVAHEDLLGSDEDEAAGVLVVLDADAKADQSYDFGYIGNKRYYRVAFDFEGTHGTETIVSVLGLQGQPDVMPTE